MRLALALFLSVTGLPAQFRHLATTDDGSRVYFSSEGTISVFDSDGLRVFARRDSTAQVLGWPSGSGDGSVIAFTRELPGVPRFQGNVARADGTVFLAAAGRAAVSRNGRFALFVDTTAAIVDLLTGATSTIEAGGEAQGRPIASDGTAVVSAGASITLFRNTGITTYPTDDVVTSAVIDDNATRVVYETRHGGIVLLDLASGVRTLVARHGARPSLSNDGEVLLYLAADARGLAQVWTARMLTADDSGIAEAVLSGDGRIAYALTRSMRILRIDTAFGDVRDLTPEILGAAADQAPLIVSFAPSPVAIEPGSSAQLCYRADHATTIDIQPTVGAVQPPQGCVSVQPSATARYTLTASNAAGSSTATTTLNVGAVRILAFTNDPAFSQASGGPVTLTWSTQNAVSVILTGRGVPSGLAVNGSVVVNPTTNTDYTLTAYGANGQSVSSVLHVFVR